MSKHDSIPKPRESVSIKKSWTGSVYNLRMRRIAITMGEPGGIGPEVAVRAALALKDAEPVLVGSADVFREAAGLIGETLSIPVIDTGSAEFTKGAATAGGGRAAYEAIRRAVAMCVSGEASAMVTAPVSKESLKMAGLPWPGHTEMLAELTGAKDFGMMLIGGGLRVVLVTIHRAIRDVPALITTERVLGTIRLAARAARMLSIDAPRIAVAALNPHAGEGGMFGSEESEHITPAIERARAEGIACSGPWPPDTVFFRARRGEFDIVVCMYHDQGLIPLKLVGFEQGVNVTVGLPIIRTSPDHGTAYDIAWQGKADPASMQEAVRLALCLKAV